MSRWGWHSFPLPEGWPPEQVPATGTFQRGRNVGRDKFPPEAEPIRVWMRENPHIMNLGRLRLMRAGGRSVQPGDISGLQRTLDLWTGVQTSRYQIAGKPLTVDTCVHPSLDMVAVRIDSPSVESGELEALLDFSCPALHNNGWVGNFDRDTGHETRVLKQSGQRVDLVRKVDAETYHASFVAGEHCSVRMPEVGVVKKKLIIRRAEYGAGDQ